MNEDNRDEEQQYQGVVDTDRAETGIETSEPSVPSEAADAETVESPQSPQVDVEFVASSDSTAETASESAPEPVEAPVMPTPSTPTEQKPNKYARVFGSKKQAIIVAVAAALLAVVGVAAYLALGPSSETSDSSAENSTKPVQKMGLAVTIVDGTANYKATSEAEWTPLATDTELTEGAQVQTGADSRAVLSFDDGSALRLDADTTVELDSLAADDLRIEQIAGAVYSRVVRSERSYTVTLDETSYKALGTAFVTLKYPQKSGLQVFESSVEVGGFDTAVGEAQQYFAANLDAELVNKVTNFELKELANDPFVAWNVAEDKKDTKFKNSLGVLAEYDKVVADEKARVEAEAKAKADEEVRLAAEKARLEAERLARQAAAPTAGMSVKLSDGGIFWEYGGAAEKGFKVLYSSTNTTPTFGQAGTSSVYVSEPRARFLNIPKDMKAGKSYYVRVCVYQPDNSSQPCGDYSNVLRVVR